jgi:hypothetical protein
LKCDKELADLSTMSDPILKGWHQYYGRFYPAHNLGRKPRHVGP